MKVREFTATSGLAGLAPIILLLGLGSAGWAVPPVPEEMRDAGYWSARVHDPDTPLLDADAMAGLNREPYRMGSLVRPWIVPRTVRGSGIRESIHADLAELTRWIKYDDHGTRLRDPGFRNSMKSLMALDGLGTTLHVRYGMAVRRSEVRRVPSIAPVRRKPGDTSFDVLSMTVLDPGDRVTAYHLSADSRWAYVQTPSCRGWIQRRDFGWLDAPAESSTTHVRLVVTGPVETLCPDPLCATEFTRASMGTGFPLEGREDDGRWIVRAANRNDRGGLVMNTGWFRADSDVAAGPLPLTPRNIAVQAFKYLGAGYAWGGTGRNVDCSGFIANVFGACGILMPRSAAFQARMFDRVELAGTPRERILQLASLPPLRTLVEFPGHIGLLVGVVDGHPWLIHAVATLNYGPTAHAVYSVILTDLAAEHGDPPGPLSLRPLSASVIGPR